MTSATAVKALAALSQESRLATYHLLVRAGNEGMPAGAISAELDISGATLSVHLSQLSSAGVVQSRRAGRSIIYSANYTGMQQLAGYLLVHCCDGVGAEPTVLRDDYAKWMLEDPKVNFSISFLCGEQPEDAHLVMQVDDQSQLEEIAQRLSTAGENVREEKGTTCC